MSACTIRSHFLGFYDFEYFLASVSNLSLHPLRGRVAPPTSSGRGGAPRPLDHSTRPLDQNAVLPHMVARGGARCGAAIRKGRCHRKRALITKKYFFCYQCKIAAGTVLLLLPAQNGWRYVTFSVTSAKPAAWPLPGNRAGKRGADDATMK